MTLPTAPALTGPGRPLPPPRIASLPLASVPLAGPFASYRGNLPMGGGPSAGATGSPPYPRWGRGLFTEHQESMVPDALVLQGLSMIDPPSLTLPVSWWHHQAVLFKERPT